MTDHELLPFNEHTPEESAAVFSGGGGYAVPVSLLKQAQSASVTDLIVMDDEDRQNFQVDYVSGGGEEEPESSRDALVCGIRHTFFREPCFQSRLIRTIVSWFWTPRTHLPYYDYMLSHLCLIAEDLNPDAKYIWVDVETGVKWPAMTGRSCRVDLNDSNNGPVAASVDLTLGSEVVQRVFQDQPSRFYADVYDLFKRQSNKVAGQKPNLTAKSP